MMPSMCVYRYNLSVVCVLLHILGTGSPGWYDGGSGVGRGIERGGVDPLLVISNWGGGSKAIKELQQWPSVCFSKLSVMSSIAC